MKNIDSNYLRATVFGFEDSLVSTTGLIAGMSAGTSNGRIILLAGLVAVAVEALSMGSGQYLSERAAQQANPHEKDSVAIGAALMFFSYLFAGLIPILPIILLPLPGAVVVSVLSAIVGLFVLGYVKGKMVRVAPVRSAMEMVIVGGGAALIGIGVGFLLKV